MKYFTHYWTNKTWEREKNRNLIGEMLDHTAGNLFTKRGIAIGDAVYIITVIKGRLYVCVKIIVDTICSEQEASRIGCQDNLCLLSLKLQPLLLFYQFKNCLVFEKNIQKLFVINKDVFIKITLCKITTSIITPSTRGVK